MKDLRTPFVVITASVMRGARVRHHLLRGIADDRNLVWRAQLAALGEFRVKVLFPARSESFNLNEVHD